MFAYLALYRLQLCMFILVLETHWLCVIDTQQLETLVQLTTDSVRQRRHYKLKTGSMTKKKVFYRARFSNTCSTVELLRFTGWCTEWCGSKYFTRMASDRNNLVVNVRTSRAQNAAVEAYTVREKQRNELVLNFCCAQAPERVSHTPL